VGLDVDDLYDHEYASFAIINLFEALAVTVKASSLFIHKHEIQGRQLFATVLEG
jgi:hypothetical protein